MSSFTTPDLYDKYLQCLQVADSGLIHFGLHSTFYGQAVTISCPNDNGLVGELVRTNGKGKVLIVDANSSINYAFLGDMLAQKAYENGWEGIVINGCVRDIEILKQIPLPVMALGNTPRKTEKKGLGSKVEAVSFLSTVITNGSWIYADLNGLLISENALDLGNN